MAHYLTSVETRLGKLNDWWVKHIPCKENRKTDTLVRVAAALPIIESILLPVYIEPTSSMALERIHDIAQTNIGWMQLIIDYLHIGEVPDDGKQTHKFRV